MISCIADKIAERRACQSATDLSIPKNALEGRRKALAILCLHQTSADLGHKVVVGLGGKANRAYASELAERGYVTLAPPIRCWQITNPICMRSAMRAAR